MSSTTSGTTWHRPAVPVRADRLWNRLMALSEIGRYLDEPSGLFGVNRLALTDADAEGRRVVKRWMEEAGLQVRVDRIGNVIGRRGGADDTLAPVMSGSHIDSVPTGGAFDGALGVIGALEVVRVEGWTKPAYVSPKATTPRRKDAHALLSPFDPMVWSRPRTERLFGFRYRLEIYTPVEKRKHGYYVLPFLLGDRLAARVDLKSARDQGTLEVRAAHLEPGVDAADVAEGLRAELRVMADWLELEHVKVMRKGNLAAALRK